MTREELIESLTILKEQAHNSGVNSFVWDINLDSFNFVIDSAIKALEQESCDYYDTYNKTCRRSEIPKEPCDDVISRQAVIDGINEYFHDGYYQRTSIQDCRDCLIEDVINYLPSVMSQHTDAEIQKMQEMKQAEIQKAYELGKEDKIKVLNKIRSEIAGLDNAIYGFEGYYMAVTDALEIIDKYKSGSEVKYESI